MYINNNRDSMSFSYNYTFSDFTVFNNGINIVNLQCEVEEAINKTFYISLRGNRFIFFFDVALTVPEIATLDNVVNNHNGSSSVPNECIPEEIIVNGNVIGDLFITGNAFLGDSEPVGNVIGTGVSTDNAIVRWNGINGNNIQNSGILIDDSDNITGAGINSDNNTITNIDDNDIKALAGINATKIGGGGVDNTEFGYLNGVTSPIQTQINNKVTKGGDSDGVPLVIGTNDSQELRFETGGQTRMTIQTDGDIGFNVVSPLASFHAESTSVGQETFIIKKIPSQTGDLFEVRDTDDTYFFKVQADGTTALIGNMTVTGTVDGRDVSVDGTVQDNHIADTDIHIPHSSVTLTAGEGLSGGGDITTSRTFDLDINSLVAEASPDKNSDFVVVYDTSAGIHRKVLLNNLTDATSVIAFEAYDNTGGQTTTSSAGTTLNLTTTRQNTGQFVLSSNEVTINESGKYLIIFRVSTDVSSGASRSTSSCWLQSNTGSGFSTVPGSFSYMYNRNASHAENTGTTSIILDLVASNSLRIQFNRNSGNDTISTIAGGSGISIVKISGGVQGPQGPPGDNEIAVESGGVAVSGSPFQTLNFINAASVIQNGGDPNQVDITVGNFGRQYFYQESDALSTTTSSTFQNKVTFTTTSLPSGTYRLGYTCEISNASNGVLTELQVTLGGSTVALPTMEADNDFLLFGGFVHRSLSGVVTANMNYRAATGGTAQIRRARLELWRVV